MQDLKPTFLSLRGDVQQALFSGMGASIKTLVSRDLPSLQTGLTGIATAFNHDFKQLFASLGSDSSVGLLERILGNTGTADAEIKAAIDPLVHAVGVLTAAGSDTLPRLADAVGAVADRFDKFITAADKDGRLKKWIDDGLTGVTHLGDTIVNLAKSFTAVTHAIGGDGLLASLDRATGKLAAFLNSAEGQQKLTRFFQEGRDEFRKWEPIIANLAKMLPALFQAAHDTAEEFRPVIKDITDYLAKNPAVVKEIAEGFLLWKTVIDPIANVAKAIRGLTELYGALKLAINGTETAALAANGAMAATGGAGAAGGAAAGAGRAAAGGAAAAGAGAAAGPLAAVVGIPLLAMEVIHPGYIGGLMNLTQGKNEKGVPFEDTYVAPPAGGRPGNPGGLSDLSRVPMSQGGLGPEPAAPPPGLPHEAQWRALADQGDPISKWVLGGADPADMAKRADWVKAHMEEIARTKMFQAPQSYSAGGPTPHGRGPGPTGGFPAELHGDEFVISARGRAAVPDSFLHALNAGNLPMFNGSAVPLGNVNSTGDASLDGPGSLTPQIPSWWHNETPRKGWRMAPYSPHDPGWRDGDLTPKGNPVPGFDVGGPTDKVADPSTNPANVGPAPIAPSPMAGGGGILNNVLGGITSGIQGPIGNAIGLIQQGVNGGFGFGTGGGGGGASVPGIWGLMQAGGNPDAMAAWGSQTANWLGNFGAKTAMSAGSTLFSGVLGGLGLGGSILSPSNVYNQAAQQTAGFFLGDQSPLMGMMGGGGSGAGGVGAQTITLGDGSSIQIPTYGTAQGATGSPAGMVNSDGTLSAGAARAIQYAQAHAVGQPYSYGGVGPNYDCSGIVSAVYAAAKGLPEGQRYFTTESDFAALGFLPGYAKGDLNIGVMRGGGGPNSHMVLTLPNGINVESGGSGNTTQYGGAARGALDLPLHWHLPLAGDQAVGSVPGLYDDGGILPAGLSLTNNQTGKPEAVLTHQQTQAYQAVAQHLASQPTPSIPQVPDAQRQQQPSPTPVEPPPTPAQAVPSPSGTPQIPASQPAGAGPLPSLAAPQVAPAPSSLDHNLKAVDTGIDSAAQAIGQAASTAIGLAAGAAGSSGFAPGAGALSAIGPYVAGLIQEGGKVAKDAVNVGSSFLVGNVTPGTQDLAYGSLLRPAQNTPNTAPAANVTQWNISGNYELRTALDQAELKQAQDHQSALASKRRI